MRFLNKHRSLSSGSADRSVQQIDLFAIVFAELIYLLNQKTTIYVYLKNAFQIINYKLFKLLKGDLCEQ